MSSGLFIGVLRCRRSGPCCGYSCSPAGPHWTRGRGLHLRITVLLQNGEERAAGGVQNFLEIVRDDHAAHTVGLQIHNEHALVLGARTRRKCSASRFSVRVCAPAFSFRPLSWRSWPLRLHKPACPAAWPAGLIHGIVQPVQVVGALDAHRDLIFLRAQESTHLVHSHPRCRSGWFG